MNETVLIITNTIIYISTIATMYTYNIYKILPVQKSWYEINI